MIRAADLLASGAVARRVKGYKMTTLSNPDLAIGILREVIVALVRRDGPALSAHQLGVYLTCYLKDTDHTVRGLAAELNVSKSVITRALDKLGEMDLTRRQPDPADRRSVLVERTEAGRQLLDELRQIVVEASQGTLERSDQAA
jgi:DNA-binding MarR family transcriptional regulator